MTTDPKTVKGIQCLKCNEFIWSRFQHDFRSCSCGASSVDGGQDGLYWRVIGSTWRYGTMNTETGEVAYNRLKEPSPTQEPEQEGPDTEWDLTLVRQLVCDMREDGVPHDIIRSEIQKILEQELKT